MLSCFELNYEVFMYKYIFFFFSSLCYAIQPSDFIGNYELIHDVSDHKCENSFEILTSTECENGLSVENPLLSLYYSPVCNINGFSYFYKRNGDHGSSWRITSKSKLIGNLLSKSEKSIEYYYIFPTAHYQINESWELNEDNLVYKLTSVHGLTSCSYKKTKSI